MAKKQPKPAARFHPGEYLADEILARGWSMDTAVKELGIQRKCIEELIAGSRPVTKLVAKCLGDGFGVDASTWIRLQESFDGKVKP